MGGGSATITINGSMKVMPMGQPSLTVISNGPSVPINASINPQEINIGETAQVSVDVVPTDAVLTTRPMLRL